MRTCGVSAKTRKQASWACAVYQVAWATEWKELPSPAYRLEEVGLFTTVSVSTMQLSSCLQVRRTDKAPYPSPTESLHIYMHVRCGLQRSKAM